MKISKIQEALCTIGAPLPLEGTFDPMTILEEAVRTILKEAPSRGMSETAPNVKGLAHLVRVLMAVHAHSVGGRRVVGFLRMQLIELKLLIQENSGNSASACRHLGWIIVRALEIMGRADDESFPIPDIFRTPLSYA